MLPYAADARPPPPEEEKYDYEKFAKEIKWHHQVLLNRPLRVSLALLITAILAPVLIYFFLFRPTLTDRSEGSCFLARTARLPCGIPNVNDTDCHPQCCYDHNNNTCFHRFPSRFTFLLEEEWSEDTIMQPRVDTVPFKNQPSIPSLRISIDEISPTHLSLTFYDPRQEIALAAKRIQEKNYIYNIESPALNVIVNRSDHSTLFNTVRGPIIASDNIWEIAVKLTDETMYGLGEIPLGRDTTKVIYSHSGGLSSIPLIFAKSNGSYHGMLIDVIDPTEVNIQGENQIVIRSITKQGLRVHVFVGPEPKHIMRDVMELIGSNKGLEYWMLGAHVCSDVSETPTEAFSGLSEFLTDAAREGVPFESHCGNAPLVFDDDSCETEENDYVERGASLVRDAGKRFVPHVSPYIKIHYEEELEETTVTADASDETTIADISDEISTNSHEDTSEDTTIDPTTAEIKEVLESKKVEESKEELECIEVEESTEVQENKEVEESKKVQECKEIDKCKEVECSVLCTFKELMLHKQDEDVYIGEIGEEYVIYPDYTRANEEFMKILWRHDIELDGLVLENSWPLDESFKFHNYTYEILPYYNEHFGFAFNNTPHWNITRPNGDMHIYSHNEYGNSFENAFKKIYNSVSIWSTSQWMNGETVVNRQNVSTSWTNLQNELVEAALGGISGHWLWSSPICGDTLNFNIDTQAALCVKWYMAATYMPMIKIHSKLVSRHPLSFLGTNRAYMISALNRRLSLLPYFYTILQDGPLLRPMFYQFPHSEALKDLKSQFSVGEDLLIVPNLHPGQSHVHVWLPPGTWYELWSGLPLDGEEGEAVTMTTTEAEFLTLIRGGSIVVMQKDVKTTAEETRLQSDYSLTIALECENLNTTVQTIIQNCSAEGSLYMTESMTLHLTANSEKLTIVAEGTDFQLFCGDEEPKWANRLKEINVYGLNDEHNNYDYHRHNEVSIDLCLLRNIVIELSLS